MGVRDQPPGFSPDPKFSLANSPVSPVDRRRLLTALSNEAHQNLGPKPLDLLTDITQPLCPLSRLEILERRLQVADESPNVGCRSRHDGVLPVFRVLF